MQRFKYSNLIKRQILSARFFNDIRACWEIKFCLNELFLSQNLIPQQALKKKHSSHVVTTDADLKEIKTVKAACKIPVMVDSGVTLKNVKKYLKVSDVLIIESYFKKNGDWKNAVEYDRVAKLMAKISG